MKTYHGFSDPALKRRARSVAIGIFDGVHRAHSRVLRRALTAAKNRKILSTALTFHPHPDRVLSPGRKHPSLLMSLAHRLKVLEEMGFDETLVVRFDRAFSRMSREDFVSRCLIGRLGVRALSVGHDFRFGRGAAGDVRYLRRRARQDRFSLFVCPAVKRSGRVISSTVIRSLVERGRLKDAQAMLGRPVSVYGTVVKGKGRGRRIGFATANLDSHQETLPPEGVYAVRGRMGRKDVRGVLHLGRRPTFGERTKTVEVHLFGQKGDLYGREMELHFVRRLRPIRRFSSPERLSAAIRRDIASARLIFALQGQF